MPSYWVLDETALPRLSKDREGFPQAVRIGGVVEGEKGTD